MSQQDLLKAPLTFCEVAASFSEEEWKLLQSWQKELYENVMRELQQALNSLGPLIAASVFSLRPKEKEDLCSVVLQDLEIRGSIDHSSGDHAFNAGDVLWKDEEMEPGLMDHYGVEGEESSTGPSLEHADIEPVVSSNIKIEEESYSMDHLNSERQEHATINTRPEVSTVFASIGINEAGETYPIDIHNDRMTRESFRSPEGNKGMDRRRNVGISFKCSETSTEKKLKANVVRSVSEKKRSINQMWSGSDQELSKEKMEQWQSDCNQIPDSNVYEMTSTTYLQRSEMHTKCESTARKDNIIPCKSNLVQSCMPYSGPGSEQIDQMKSNSGHQQPQEEKGRYTCTECGKSLAAKKYLKRHERIHTGERPFICTICGKSFNQNGALHRHKRIHVGNQPYQCSECGTSFTQKHNLLAHQNRHKSA